MNFEQLGTTHAEHLIARNGYFVYAGSGDDQIFLSAWTHAYLIGGSGNDTYVLGAGSYGVLLDSSGNDTVVAPFGIDSAAAVTVGGGQHLLLADTHTGTLIFILDRHNHPIETLDLQGYVGSQDVVEAAIRANGLHLGDVTYGQVSDLMGVDARWLANMLESEISYILARESELFSKSEQLPPPHHTPGPQLEAQPNIDHNFTETATFFSAEWYLTQNADVAAAGIDPLWHYMQFGWHEGRDPNPYMDSDWYLAQNPDVARAGVNPAEHYWNFGWQEGRDPSEIFSTTSYLDAHPDVALAGLNPLEHYLFWGIHEGREIAPVG